MFNGQKINELIEINRVKKVTVYNYADLSKTQFDNIINGNSIPRGDTLERIADFFKVPIDYFFEREVIPFTIGHHVSGSRNRVTGDITLNELSECKKENEHLKELLAEKERTIQILMKMQA